MPFNFSSPEYLSHHRTRKNRVSPVSRASPAHMNSPSETAISEMIACLMLYKNVHAYLDIILNKPVDKHIHITYILPILGKIRIFCVS